MSWLSPLDIGLVMGLILAWPVVAFAAAFRLLNFPDLTLEGSLPTGAATCAVILHHGYPTVLALGAGMLAGACLGALTAIIHVRLHVNKFLAGIIVVAISYTLDLRIMNSSNIGLIRTASLFDIVAPIDAALGTRFQFGTVVFLGVTLMIGCWLLVRAIRSIPGMQLRVAGSNPEYARALGISVPITLVVGLAVTNSLVGGAGALLAMYQGFADVSMGQGILILALASMTIGERLIPEQSVSIPVFVVASAIVGALVYQALIAYAVRLGLAATDLKLATALFVLIAIAVRLKNKNDDFLEAIR